MNLAETGANEVIFAFFLGIALNYLGILKLIDLLKNENTRYIFQKKV